MVAVGELGIDIHCLYLAFIRANLLALTNKY